MEPIWERADIKLVLAIFASAKLVSIQPISIVKDGSNAEAEDR